MKRTVVILLVLCLSVQTLVGAQVVNAALTCKQVKTEVLKLEKAVAVEQAYFVNYEGQNIKGKLKAEFAKSNKNMYLQKLGKFQYNNEACFTKSQYDQILQAHNWTASFTILFREIRTARDSDCKNNSTSRQDIDLGIYQPKGTKRGLICDVPVYLVVDVKNYLYGKSIYEY